MAKKIDDGFKREVAQFALTSDLSRKQVAADFGVGLSSVDRWVKLYGHTNSVGDSASDLVAENKRLRKELQIAQQERDILKKATAH